MQGLNTILPQFLNKELSVKTEIFQFRVQKLWHNCIKALHISTGNFNIDQSKFIYADNSPEIANKQIRIDKILRDIPTRNVFMSMVLALEELPEVVKEQTSFWITSHVLGFIAQYLPYLI